MGTTFLFPSLKCMRACVVSGKLIRNNVFMLRHLTTGNQPCPTNATEVQCHERRRVYNFGVNRFGQLHARTGTGCHLNVEPVQPELCPDQNAACVTSTVFASTDVSKIDNFYTRVDYKDSCLSICTQDSTSLYGIQSREELNVNVPIKYNIDAEVSGDSKVSISNIQNESVQVKTQQGSCLFNNVQSGDVDIETAGGSIVCDGVLHGNATLKTKGRGCITINRPICQQLDVKTDRGDITIDSLYAERSKFVVKSGNVKIKNAHRSINIEIVNNGNVAIDSLDGSLRVAVSRGDVGVFVCQHNTVDITVGAGNIVIKVPVSLDSKLELSATDITLDDKLDSSNLLRCNSQSNQTLSGFMVPAAGGVGLEKAAIKACTKQGTIKLVCQDWLSSLNLGDFDET